MIRGAYTALITPFQNGRINYKKMGELIEFQIANKIDGLVVCGTTGEASTLSLKEKKKLKFIELFEDFSKPYVVVTFLSVLEMTKNKEITIKQDNNFSDIYLERVD